MNKIIPIIIIIVALVGIAWYYVGTTNKKNDTTAPAAQTQVIDVALATSEIVGTWQSTDDEKAVVIFNANGTTVDVYDGEELSRGSWVLSAAEEQEGASPRLTTTINGEEYNYALWSVDETELVINYSIRGNTLTYTRVIEPLLDTSAWQEYMNDEYSFTLAHPQDWEVQEALKPREQFALHEILIFEDMESIWRASASVFIFPNEERYTVEEWWGNWLALEDTKEAECRVEYGEDSPCLFLRGIVEWEKNTQLSGIDALTVGLFRFDHEEECTYAAVDDYVYGICAPGTNPNDPREREHRRITDTMKASFSFN